MREIIYSAACSLDGFIAGPHGEIDWIDSGPDARRYLAELWPTIDTLIMGRKTYVDSLAYAGDGNDTAIPGVESYVFSRTLERVQGTRTHLVRDDAAGFVRRLKAQPGKRIFLFGGGVFARAMFEAGLVDEIGISVHPVLLGSGTPLFVDPGRRISLQLSAERPMDGRCVLLHYRVTHA